MASTLKVRREDDKKVVVSERSSHRLPAEGIVDLPAAGVVDLDELVGVAEYLVPARHPGFTAEPSREEVEAIIKWADGNVETLRRAWILAMRRCGVRTIRGDTVKLLTRALQRARSATSRESRLPGPFAHGTGTRVAFHQRPHPERRDRP